MPETALPDTRAPRADRSFKIATVIVFAVLYLLFIDRFSVDLNGQRYFVLSDDQMVSMRYADNLAAGQGLVWNPGERVEGFTNPLWTAYMAIWHLVGVSRPKASLPIMLTSGVILILNALAVYSIASRLSPRSPSVARVAMVLAGTYWSLVQWSLEGFEVGLTALLTSVVVLQAFTYVESRQLRRLAAIAACLIALGWTRLEMLAVAGVPVAYLLVFETARARILSIVVVPVVACVALLFAARHWYFNEWLPNTYYLKLTGVALGDRLYLGLQQASSTVLTHFSMVLAPITLACSGFKDDRRTWTLVALGAVAMLYTIYIGGDTWERPYHANRFLATTTPLLIVVALHMTREHILRAQGPPRAATLVVVALGVLMAVGLSGRRFYMWLGSDITHWKLFVMAEIGERLREQAPVDSSVAVVWAGALPYFSRLHAVDLLGKSDKVIARSTPHNMEPGHNKWDYTHSIGALKPNYIIELWKPTAEDIDYITGLGYSRSADGIYVRRSR